MILYTLTNAALKMDVYEDKVVFHPSWWKSSISKQWEAPIVIPYAKVERVVMQKRVWPLSHQLIFYTAEQTIQFNFRRLYPFFERLHVYLERQLIRYYNQPQGLPKPNKSVLDLLEEKKRNKTPRQGQKSQQAA